MRSCNTAKSFATSSTLKRRVADHSALRPDRSSTAVREGVVVLRRPDTSASTRKLCVLAWSGRNFAAMMAT